MIINPNGVEVTTECDAAPPPSSWTNAISGGRGLQSDLAVGYDWGAVRFEVEYFYRVTAYNDRVDANVFDEVTLDKQEQELERADGGADDLQSHNVFANVYYDLTPTSSPWNPYIGGGVGAEWASLSYFSHWKRNDNPDRITTFVDPLLRAAIAGTTTIGEARLAS